MSRPVAATLVASLLLLLPACGSPPARNQAPTASSSNAAASPDPLGTRPPVVDARTFKPPTPLILAGPGGARVLLFERHSLPLVAVSVVVPYGSAAEPADSPGLAYVAAKMIEQGAGERDAAAFALALDDLGAQLSTSVDRDSSIVGIECISSRLPAAWPLMLDAIAAPRHQARDFERVSALWIDELRQRADEPREVALLVAEAALYGPASPYGHPAAGTLATATSMTLDRLDAWHRAIWRPDAATIVVVGDVTADQLTPLLAQSRWANPEGPPPSLATAPALPPPRARIIVVDRPEAPQVMVQMLSAGVAADDPARARLDALNVALGGSFTSRLNEDLREDHGWCYGAGSRFVAHRATGAFHAGAAIRADALAEALRELRSVVGEVALHGITEAELTKSKAQCEGDAIDAYGTISSIASRLARNAALGLGPAADADELAAQRSVTLEQLAVVARAHLEVENAIIVMVGPSPLVLKAIADDRLPAAETCDAEAVGLRSDDAAR